MKKIIYSLIVVLAMAACRPEAPGQYKDVNESAAIFPDYEGVTVPCNLAPLRFTIDNDAQEYVTRLSSEGVDFVYGGRDVCPETDEWQKMVAVGDIQVEIFLLRDGEWSRMKPFRISVSSDSIDPYIAYRLISPSYVTYEDLTINQRCLENYDESIIYGNMINSTEQDGQCINCHSFQSYNPRRMQMHMRQYKGGTFITMDGKSKKVGIKHVLRDHSDIGIDSLVTSGGVYPAWHPTLPLIAYSSNHTGQSFHTRDLQKIEVYDSYSDLILYDVEKEKVMEVEVDTMQLASYPAWSPDGKWLYYCSAAFERDSTQGNRDYDVILHYRNIFYNLYRRKFDARKMEFGERELVYDAAADSMSVTLPRISPDGRKLMFTRGRFGVFHIWHTDADLCMMDMASGSVRSLDEINSPSVESYHSWSSNGKWIIFSSRRTDGNFTRPYMAHMESDGTFTKPVELPTRNPHFHREFLRSYNIPEFISGKVEISAQEIAGY